MLESTIHKESPDIHSVITDPLFLLDVIAPASTAGEVISFFHFLDEAGLEEIGLSLLIRWATKDEEVSVQFNEEECTLTILDIEGEEIAVFSDSDETSFLSQRIAHLKEGVKRE